MTDQKYMDAAALAMVAGMARVLELKAEADTLRAEVARLAAALEAITLEYDTSGHGTIAEIMFGIARAALAHGEADQ
tara:strand:- start:119 stop:349 length:231 start_codon:yes stop_codon:yes gene_type:complete